MSVLKYSYCPYSTLRGRIQYIATDPRQQQKRKMNQSDVSQVTKKQDENKLESDKDSTLEVKQDDGQKFGI